VVYTGFPTHMGTKVTDVEQLLRPVLYQVATNSSLAVTVSTAAAAGIIEMSAVALHKRMRTIGPYLAQLVAQMTDAEMTFAPERWAGYDPGDRRWLRGVPAWRRGYDGACSLRPALGYASAPATGGHRRKGRRDIPPLRC